MTSLNHSPRAPLVDQSDGHRHVTPELIDYHVRLGRRLRAEAIRNGFRAVRRSLARRLVALGEPTARHIGRAARRAPAAPAHSSGR